MVGAPRPTQCSPQKSPSLGCFAKATAGELRAPSQSRLPDLHEGSACLPHVPPTPYPTRKWSSSSVQAAPETQLLYTLMPATLLPETCFPLAGRTVKDGPLSHWELALMRVGAGQDAPTNINHGVLGVPTCRSTSLGRRARQSGTLPGLGMAPGTLCDAEGWFLLGLDSPPGVARATAPGLWSTEKCQRHTSIAFFPRAGVLHGFLKTKDR